MATPLLASDTKASQVLDTVRELLLELGSEQAAETLSLNSSLDRELGLGSLKRVELLVRIERRFQCRLADDVAQLAETPSDWLRAINGDGPTTKPEGRYRIVQPSQEAPSAPRSATSFVEVLRHHADRIPDRVHVHLLDEDSGRDISYADLLEASSEVAAGLAQSGLEQNEAVAIMLPTCADFFYAFLGVALAGGIAVPIYPPARPDQIEEYVRRQTRILRSAEACFLIAFERVKAVSRVMRLGLPSLEEVTTVGALRERGAGRAAPAIEPADTFFVQYTSGSTGNPKGVVLSHANVLANVKAIGRAVEARPDDAVVSWLPLYHDMGLIGSWLFSVYHAFPITIFSPLAFLSRPERWLWALSDSGGTLCPAPNFAYELSARKITDDLIQGVDLSRWRVAITGGEAVLPETLERFAARFAPYGFRSESYLPCYGLAESSVALTFPPINRRPVIDSIRRDVFEREGRAVPLKPGEDKGIRFVANGKPLAEHEVQIVDDGDRPLGERVQGRLLFRGPSRTAGYFRNDQATRAAIGEDGWMDSGDLAYWADGEVYVTGRKKDIIIKAGHNIAPQEVEAAAAEVAGVRRGCVSAFGTLDRDTGTEKLVVAAETRTADRQEMAAIRARVVKHVEAALGQPPDHVELVPPQTIPKTSSGKIRRAETRALYESGKLRAGKRPPWWQLVRLWSEHLTDWAKLAAGQAGRRRDRAYDAAVVFLVGVGFGMPARLLPDRGSAAPLVRAAARLIFRLQGRRVKARHDRLGDNGSGAVLMANRSGDLDPLAAVAALPGTVLISEPTVLTSLPLGIAFLLEPLVPTLAGGETVPPGGALQDRVRQGLLEGHWVLVFADNLADTAPSESRFRLDAIQAAIEAGLPLKPVRIIGAQQAVSRTNGGRGENPISVTVGDDVRLETTSPDGLAKLRDRIRKAIGELGG